MLQECIRTLGTRGVIDFLIAALPVALGTPDLCQVLWCAHAGKWGAL